MDTRDEYVLTSSDEAFALGEQGRELVLRMSAVAYERTLRAALITLKEACDERSWNDYDRESAVHYLGGLRSTAYTLLKSACQVDGRDNLFSMALYRVSAHFSADDEVRELTYFEPNHFDRQIRTILTRYREAENGAALDALRAMYAATDPTIAREYAEALIPAEGRKVA